MHAFGKAMMALHDELDARFFRHRQALLDRDVARATAALADYDALLRAHVADEEALVLPAYAAIGGDASDAPLALFLGEHRKLAQFVATFHERLRGLATAPSDRAILELLDRQATFLNLFLHHDLRERNALYPRLSSALSGDELARLETAIRARPAFAMLRRAAP